MSRNRQIYESWMAIIDSIGDAKLWPKHIRRLFWTKNVVHWERILIASFSYVNGLNPVMLLEWADLMGLCRDGSGRRHLQALYQLFENRNYRLYAFNVDNNRYEWLDICKDLLLKV